MSKEPEFPLMQCPACQRKVDEMRAEPTVYEFADSPYYHYEPSKTILMLPCGCEIEREKAQ